MKEEEAMKKALWLIDQALWKKWDPEHADEIELYSNLTVADIWLRADISYLIRQEVKDSVKEVVETAAGRYGAAVLQHAVEIYQEAEADARIRSDFKAALSAVSRGSELSHDLGYSFYESDIGELARLHKSGSKHIRRKIEELLEDCNFHKECGDFSSRRYETYIK